MKTNTLIITFWVFHIRLFSQKNFIHVLEFIHYKIKNHVFITSIEFQKKNGLEKTKHQHLVEITLALLFLAFMPPKFRCICH